MATQEATPKSSFLWKSLPYFILAHASHHILTALPQPMLPYIQQEFNLNYSQSAAITSAFSLSTGASQLPSGWLGDRIGPTILITAGILGVAIGGFFIGLSHNYTMLIIAMVFMGLMAGGYHPASAPLISTMVPPNLRGRALGLHQIGGNASYFLAPLIAGGIAAAWGWRGAYITLAVPTAVLGVFFFFYLSRRYGKSHMEAMKRRQIEENPPQPGYKRRLIAFMIMMIVSGGAVFSVNSFLSLYMVNELGASKESAAIAMSIIFSSGIWIGFLGGFISDRIGSTKVIIASGIFSGLIIFALNEVHQFGWMLWIVLWVIGIFQAVRFPVTEVFIMNQAPARHRSTIYGLYYSTMQYTGAIFAPVMGGFIDAYGFHSIFTYTACIATGITIISAFFIWDAKG